MVRHGFCDGGVHSPCVVSGWERSSGDRTAVGALLGWGHVGEHAAGSRAAAAGLVGGRAHVCPVRVSGEPRARSLVRQVSRGRQGSRRTRSRSNCRETPRATKLKASHSTARVSTGVVEGLGVRVVVGLVMVVGRRMMRMSAAYAGRHASSRLYTRSWLARIIGVGDEPDQWIPDTATGLVL